MKVRCHLRRIRERQGVGLREMAERAGVNHGLLSGIERGQALPSDGWIEQLEEAYGVRRALWYPRDVLLSLEYDDDGKVNAT